MSDWDEIQKLAADLQRAQLSGSIQKLSENNCIEIVNKLIKSGLLKVIFTCDGKEYMTHKQLEREIDDEVYMAKGRIALSDLATNLNVDYSHVDVQAQHLAKSDRNVHLVLGQIVNARYLDSMAEVVNERLQVDGTTSVSTLAKEFNLPADFLHEQIVARLGKFIEGFQDENDPRIIMTPAYMSRYRAKIRGILTAATVPVPVTTVVKEFALDGRMFFNLADEMIRDNTVQGAIVGSRQSGKATFVPAAYARAQNEWVDNFMAQNGYVEYASLSGLGIADPAATMRRRFKGSGLTFLSGCCLGEAVRIVVEAQVEEALNTKSFVDVAAHLPSAVSTDDAAVYVANEVVPKYDAAEVFCDTIVASKGLVKSLADLFGPEVRSMAEQRFASGEYARQLKAGYETADTRKLMAAGQTSSSSSDKKDDRRKKAAEGKAGGGAQGRETKTKSAKAKKARSRKAADEVDHEAEAPQHVVAFMSADDLADKLGQVDVLEDAPDGLCAALALALAPSLDRQYESALAELHTSAVSASVQSKRRNHVDFVGRVNAMVENLRLFEKGLAAFEDDKDRAQLERYLAKSLGSDVLNEIVGYGCQEHQVSTKTDTLKELNSDQRLKLIGQLPKDMAEALAGLNKCLADNRVADFLAGLDVAGPLCDMTPRKVDKKRDRQVVYNHRQSLARQLDECADPASALHLAALAIFQAQTGAMLHASGKFVPAVLGRVSAGLDGEQRSTLDNFQSLVVRHMNAPDGSDEADSLKRRLDDGLKSVKDVVAAVAAGRPAKESDR